MPLLYFVLKLFQFMGFEIFISLKFESFSLWVLAGLAQSV
jgi:hypothetical protein